jgi:hypothetical protein
VPRKFAATPTGVLHAASNGPTISRTPGRRSAATTCLAAPSSQSQLSLPVRLPAAICRRTHLSISEA